MKFVEEFVEEFAAYFPGYRRGGSFDVLRLDYEVGIETRPYYIMAVYVPLGVSAGWAAAWITAGHVYAGT